MRGYGGYIYGRRPSFYNIIRIRGYKMNDTTPHGLNRLEVICLVLFAAGIILTVWQYYAFILTADTVTCDKWGNCVATTVLKNSTESRECFENGQRVDCGAFTSWAERTGYNVSAANFTEVG